MQPGDHRAGTFGPHYRNHESGLEDVWDGESMVWDRVARTRRDCMCYLGPPTLMPIGMRKSPDLSPRRLSDISPQLRQLKYLVVDEAIKEDLKSSRSVEDINSASIEERILRITGYYGYQPWNASYKSESVYMHGAVNFCECML
ncbi:hypothetical protein KUCAC02_024574 [Chaenocephalus aceratus]|uniref:Uncharacterized protein n=1 Tax=Chaenocephalus aceratus TaxID=36190 RepID=A0ACB9WIF2_CHAAC|nr:hypothetical protein KUCAC02_024574 [Chaenocephalus aceratus]